MRLLFYQLMVHLTINASQLLKITWQKRKYSALIFLIISRLVTASLTELEDKVESLETDKLQLQEKLRSVEADKESVEQQMEARLAELDTIKVS